MTDDMMNLHGPLEKSADLNVLRETIGFAAGEPHRRGASVECLVEEDASVLVLMASTGVAAEVTRLGLCRAV